MPQKSGWSSKSTYRSDKNRHKKTPSSLFPELIVGIILAAVGVFWILQSAEVTFNWYFLRLGGFFLPTGVAALPLVVGIGMLVYNPRALANKLVFTIGLAVLILALVLSVRIYFRTSSLFEFIMMFGMLAGGVGLILRALLKKA